MATESPKTRPDAAGVTHNGRKVPPDDWEIETVPGSGQASESMQMVRVGNAWLPTMFTMHLKLPEPDRASMQVVYGASVNGVTILAVGAVGMDAVQAVDTLRRIAPVEVWNRVAVLDMGVRLLAVQFATSEDGLAYLAAGSPYSEEEWRELLESLKPKSGRWPTGRPGAPTIPAEASSWTAALDAWRSVAEAGTLADTVRSTPTVRKGRRNQVTAEHLAAVAEVYRKANQAGDPPTLAVAEAFQTSHSTATRWVGMARDKGLLGPARKGKSGETRASEGT